MIGWTRDKLTALARRTIDFAHNRPVGCLSKEMIRQRQGRMSHRGPSLLQQKEKKKYSRPALAAEMPINRTSGVTFILKHLGGALNCDLLVGEDVEDCASYKRVSVFIAWNHGQGVELPAAGRKDHPRRNATCGQEKDDDILTHSTVITAAGAVAHDGSVGRVVQRDLDGLAVALSRYV